MIVSPRESRTIRNGCHRTFAKLSWLRSLSAQFSDAKLHTNGAAPRVPRKSPRLPGKVQRYLFRVHHMMVGHIVPLGGDTCDFCCTSPVAKVYCCRNFEWSQCPVFEVGLGVWASCRKCAELVDAEKWSVLTERALRKFVKRHQIPKQHVPTIRSQLAEVHRLFSEHRIRES